MKQVIHKIVSFLMIFVVLFSTMSFTIDEHYCGDILVNSSMLSSADSCGMDMLQTSSTKESIREQGCCHNQKITVFGQNGLNVLFDNFTFDQQIFIVSFVNSYLNLFEKLEYKTPSFSEFPPPLVLKKLYKLGETYLI